MSLKVISRVWSDYPRGGMEMMLALVLADRADDSGYCPLVSLSELARAIREDANDVNRLLAEMRWRDWLDEVERVEVDEYDNDPSIAWQINKFWIETGHP